MANQLPRTLQPPPDLPPDPTVSNVLSQYLRTFSLWCRHGFADKLSISTAAPYVTLQDDAVPAAVYQLKVTSAPTLTLTPMALGSGALGDPIEIALRSDLSGYLPITGGTISPGGLAIAGELTLNSGVTFLPSTAPGDDPVNLTNHIDLYGGVYGFSITGGTLNLVSNGAATIQCATNNATVNGSLTATNTLTSNGNLQTYSGIVQCFSQGGNAHFWLYDQVGTSKGLLYWQSTTDTLYLQHGNGNGNVQFEPNGFIHLNTSKVFLVSNAIDVDNHGLSFPGVAYGTGNRHAFGWSNVVSGCITGIVDNGGAAYGLANASDERMKEGIEPSTFDCLSTVLNIPLKQFRWKEFTDPWKLKEAKATKDAPVIPVGVIAQEVHKIFPAGVQKGDAFDDHLGVVWGLDQNVMISLLLGAVQQLTKRVAELEAR